MRPDAVTLLFKEAFDIFPPIEGKPTDDDLLAIREALLPILMVIPFDAVGGIHSLTALLMDEAKYATAHGGNKFVRPVRLPLYDELIAMGSKSAADAYQVGVLIEEKDIADITAQLATTPDQAVVDVLEKLRSASENHLRAFNRQL